MKRTLILFVISVLLFFCGCEYQPPLRQPVENIVQIELIDNSSTGDTILGTLSDAEIPIFMGDLRKLECNKRLQPVGDFSDLELRIYYVNGDVDLFGSRANGYIEGGNLIISGWYYYDEDALRDLFSAYIN